MKRMDSKVLKKKSETNVSLLNSITDNLSFNDDLFLHYCIFINHVQIVNVWRQIVNGYL